jgi:P2-related tail formation protein
MQKITKQVLHKLYIQEGRSIPYIAKQFSCSENKINYWAKKFEIKKRSIAEAVYLQNNPNGDPFSAQKPVTKEDWFLYGLGMGLYWGEGNKANTHAVRLGNTDAGLIRKFLQFLKIIYHIDTKRLRFGLQLFTDIQADAALRYWCRELSVSPHQFQKIVVTKSVRKGTYTKKAKYGVLTVYFSNIKLRDIIVSAITKLQNE